MKTTDVAPESPPTRSQGETAEFLMAVFGRWNANDVRYCVLRNYENLPHDVGNDLDLLVAPSDIKKLRADVVAAAAENGWRLIKDIKRSSYHSLWMVSVDLKEVLHIDAWTSCNWKGIAFADTTAVLKRRRRVDSFYVPAPVDEACDLLLKDLLATGRVRRKYSERIASTAERQAVEMVANLQEALGSVVGSRLVASVKGRMWGEIDGQCVTVRRALVLRALSKRFSLAVLGIIGFIWGHLTSVLRHPNGVFVVLVGPDGSGKSSIAHQVQEKLRDTFSACQYYHGHFHILPELKTIRKWFHRGGCQPEDSYREASRTRSSENNGGQHGILRSLIYLMYYSFDYFLGRFVVAKARSRGDLVVFDRYFYDYFVQPGSRRLPRHLLVAMGAVLPRPDVLLYLKCEPEEIYRRKPELTPDEIRKQQEIIEGVLCPSMNCLHINTSRNLGKTGDEVRDLILDHMLRRFTE